MNIRLPAPRLWTYAHKIDIILLIESKGGVITFSVFSKVLKVVTSRLFFYAVLIVLQLVLFWGVLIKLVAYFVPLLVILYIVSFFAVLVITTRDQDPSFKIAWIIAVLCFPLLGGLFYLIWQLKSKDVNRRRSSQRSGYDYLYSPLAGDLAGLHDGLPWLHTQSKYISRVSGFPPYSDTDVEYLAVGEDFWARLLEELAKAEKFILLEYFIIAPGKMWEAIFRTLEDKIKNGVEVMLLYDDVGCMTKLPYKEIRRMKEAGIKVAEFNAFRPTADPVLNYRDHRKICVVDGKVGFCGGINFADEYINAWNRCGHWKDTAVMLRGSAVDGLTRIFLQLWSVSWKGGARDYREYLVQYPVTGSGYVQPFPDDPCDSYNVAENVYIQMINRADSYIYITTPYLILDSEMTSALKTAAESGIDVRIITPAIPDKGYVFAVTRSNYLPLLHSGVKIYEYTPGFMHAKMLISDDCCAVVGTANLDYRSLYLHYECAVALYDVSAIGDIKNDLLDCIVASRQMTVEEMESVPLLRRILVAILKLFSPMM